MPAKVLSNERLAARLFRMSVEAPAIAENAAPGQFVMVRVNDGLDPLLRRPLSIHRVTGGGTVHLLYRAAGRGTNLLKEVKPGSEINILGPLGSGFTLPEPGASVIIAAGGIGIAPFPYLADRLLGVIDRTMIALYFGGKSAEDLVAAAEFEKLKIRTVLTTEDGSRGARGLITEALQRDMGKFDPDRTVIYTCGPTAMMKRVAALADEAGIRCEASLERRMACGVGACMGCVTRVRLAGDRSEAYERVCNEGPVFDARRVVWDHD